MRKVVFVVGALLAVGACDSREEAAPSSAPVEAALDRMPQFEAEPAGSGFAADKAAPRMARPDLAASAPAPAPPPPAPPPPPPPPGAPQDGGDLADAGAMLAYRYGATLELPARNVRAVMSAHEAACRDAGPRVCQLLSSNVNESGVDYVYGYLTLRAEPQWLAAFRAGLEGDAQGAEGRVTGTTVTAEDLTTQIVDTDAQLKAQRTLRERLEGLLATQQGDVGDLLAVERELARVQGQIDSAASQLAVMRTRVEMSTMDLSYSSKAVALPDNAFSPLGDALTGFIRVLSESAGSVVTFVAKALPWIVVLLPLGWLGRRWWRARGARRKASAA